MKYRIMGILNVTPDSFSDGGKYFDPGAAADRALEMEAEGADIIDIGAESSRPGAAPVPAGEEILRLRPVLEKIAGKIRIPVSVDTYKYETASFAVSNGATIINDITALSDPRMIKLVKDKKIKIILMHMQGAPRTMQENPEYKDVVGEIRDFFIKKIKLLENEGIGPQDIIVDPGIGFGKTVEHNLELIRNADSFTGLGCEALFGVSRKTFIGKITGRDASSRLAGSLAVTVFLAGKGVGIFRTHDVRETRDALSLISAIQA